MWWRESCCARHKSYEGIEVLYFLAHKTHCDFFVIDFRKKKKNSDECILILVIYWKKTGLLHTKISNHIRKLFIIETHKIVVTATKIIITLKMLYNRCTGIYKFGNSTYPRPIRSRSNLGHTFRGKNCVLWAGKYGMSPLFLKVTMGGISDGLHTLAALLTGKSAPDSRRAGLRKRKTVDLAGNWTTISQTYSVKLSTGCEILLARKCFSYQGGRLG
jgi:hypothetical protein